jgi:hypothetical protein
MDPFLETNPVFHELHTQMLAEAQRQLQPQLRPQYVARLERPSASLVEEVSVEDLALRKQRRIVIYVKSKPRLAVASIELLSPSNKDRGSIGQARYLEKRSPALRGGLHWIEVDLLRGGERPFVPVEPPTLTDYRAYVAQATPTGWNHLVYGWGLRDRLPELPIPLLGSDQAVLDLGACFEEVYDVIAADDEAAYDLDPPPPSLMEADQAWVAALLEAKRLRC